jgi:hypothetical protein
MTHHYQYTASLPHSKKRLNAAFVHRMKKLCGRVYRLHVVETFADEDYGDYIVICNKNKRIDAKNAILALCAAYGIGKDYIFIYDDEFDATKEYINVYLSQPNPNAD